MPQRFQEYRTAPGNEVQIVAFSDTQTNFSAEDRSISKENATWAQFLNDNASQKLSPFEPGGHMAGDCQDDFMKLSI